MTAADHDYQTDETYSYDATGNRTNTGYTTGDNNRLTSDGTYDYLYDDEGNRTKKTEISSGDYVEYEWDHRNRLTKVTFRDDQDAKTKEVIYTYDALDRLIIREVDDNGNGTIDSEEKFVYDGDDVVLVYDASDELTQRFLHGPGVDQVFAQEDDAGDILWALSDNLGTVRDIADYDAGSDTTTVDNHRKFDAYGNITAESDSSVEFRYAFTGRYFDEDTNLQYNRARWYDGAVGRWLSEDPIGFAAGDANVNRYVGNDPTNFVDPSGLEELPGPPTSSNAPPEPSPPPPDGDAFFAVADDEFGYKYVWPDGDIHGHFLFEHQLPNGDKIVVRVEFNGHGTNQQNTDGFWNGSNGIVTISVPGNVQNAEFGNKGSAERIEELLETIANATEGDVQQAIVDSYNNHGNAVVLPGAGQFQTYIWYNHCHSFVMHLHNVFTEPEIFHNRPFEKPPTVDGKPLQGVFRPTYPNDPGSSVEVKPGSGYSGPSTDDGRQILYH